MKLSCPKCGNIFESSCGCNAGKPCPECRKKTSLENIMKRNTAGIPRKQLIEQQLKQSEEETKQIQAKLLSDKKKIINGRPTKVRSEILD